MRVYHVLLDGALALLGYYIGPANSTFPFLFGAFFLSWLKDQSSLAAALGAI